MNDEKALGKGLVDYQYASPKPDEPNRKRNLAVKYEDNIKFCRRRYSEAQVASNCFLKHYTSNIDAYLISIITPNDKWGFKLSKYKKWAAHCGFGDTYTDEEWSAFSANY